MRGILMSPLLVWLCEFGCSRQPDSSQTLVTPKPPAEFSPLATTRSIWNSRRRSGTRVRMACRPGLPITSPIMRMRNVQDS